MNEIYIIAIAAAVVVIGMIIIAVRTRAVERRMERIMGALKHMNEISGNENERLRASLSDNMEKVRSSVDSRLMQVQRGLGEMRAMAADVGDLKRVMSNVKSRGIWGETQLRAIMQETLAAEQYMENVAVVPMSAERVEFALRLPDKDGNIQLMSIDSKFPLEEYMRLVTATENGNSDDYQRASKALERRFIDEAKRISSKYICPPHTVDFAVMFLPVESLYAEAARMAGLCEKLQTQYRVLVAGPNTFAALITSLRVGFRSAAIEKRGAEVLRALEGMREDIAKLGELTAKAKQHAAQFNADVEAIEVRERAILRKIREISNE